MQPTITNATQTPGGVPLSTPTIPDCQRWDRALVRFLKSAGLIQALSGFENDMLVMNQDSEREDIPPALRQLHHDLISILQIKDLPVAEESKLEYTHVAEGFIPVSHTQLTRSISSFIARNRARNNASNRNEFLRKRRRVAVSTDATGPDVSSSSQTELPTCARTDAVPVNREVQMKYDIAKNEDGPLRRTMKSEQTAPDDARHKSEVGKGKGRANALLDEDQPTLQQHPGLGDRFANLETHLAVRYVPSPPASLLDRIRFLEDYIIRLERDYPPWAALHFNQPNRGWPPPPRATPLIVPSHLTSTYDLPQMESAEHNSSGISDPTLQWSGERSWAGSSRGNAAKTRGRAKSSSLHRAVMRKLEVKAALAGES